MLGIRQEVGFEAQAAMELEMLADSSIAHGTAGYDQVIAQISGAGTISLTPLITAIVNDLIAGETKAVTAAKFHRTLVEMFVRVATSARDEYGIGTVALSGGVYQNTLFFELMLRRLQETGFAVLTHAQVPTNDGGLALGQIAVANAVLNEKAD